VNGAPDQRRIYCNSCRRETWHNRVASHPYSDDVYDGEYILWACAGCDNATMEDRFNHPGLEPEEHESVFHPKRAVDDRTPKRFRNLPRKLQTLYDEVLNANNSGSDLLCTVGLRALIEGICVDKKVHGNNLDERIEAMKTLLPENIVKSLHGFRFMGNRAAHELEAASTGELSVALDLAEDILNYLYDLDYKARVFDSLSAIRNAPPKANPW
jgi:hypothetical protein